MLSATGIYFYKDIAAPRQYYRQDQSAAVAVEASVQRLPAVIADYVLKPRRVAAIKGYADIALFRLKILPSSTDDN